MAFDTKDWEDSPSTDTPVSAAALIDTEDRVTDYTDSIAAGGVELGTAAITSDATRNSTTLADVSGLTTTVTVGTRPIAVIFSCGSSNNNNGTGGVVAAILEDGTQVATVSTFLGASAAVPLFRYVRRAPAAGSHTYKIQLKTLFGGTATISAASDNPARISVIEV